MRVHISPTDGVEDADIRVESASAKSRISIIESSARMLRGNVIMATQESLLCLSLLVGGCVASDADSVSGSTDAATTGTSSGTTSSSGPATSSDAATSPGDDDGDMSSEGTSSSGGDSSTGSDSHLASVRVAHMSLEQGPLRLCVDGEALAPFEETTLAYPQMTAYIRVPQASEVAFVLPDEDCTATPLAAFDIDLPQDSQATLVLYGDPGLPDRPLETAVLADSPQTLPTNPKLARVRLFHTDTDVDALDVGVSPAPGVQVLIFDNVPYGGSPAGSDVGQLDEHSYVDGVPISIPTDRLNIWHQGTTDVLGWVAAEDLLFEPGKVFSVFAAGRATTGTPEAVVCRDELTFAMPRARWASCEVAIPNQTET
ncbi:MAG: DUF4397 domain-containing protein [Nannocystaceae bacterium]|nr:DUF4397 domain-containing protein [Nannocystaceae bacterium]